MPRRYRRTAEAPARRTVGSGAQNEAVAIVDPLRAGVLKLLSGQESGIPKWIADLELGEDAGYFPVGGAVWTVHCNIATLAAGPRALLVQALHPGAMAGVHDHSRYREDPFGRLAGTIRWISTVSYGSTGQARAASAFVSSLHTRVRGTYPGADGVPVPYAASDPDLLAWVHLAFADSFLRTHLLLGTRPIPGGPDAYVREWAVAGELMGVADPPRSVAELDRQLDDVWASGILRVDERVRDAVRFIRRPPLPLPARVSYPALFAGSVAALSPRARAMLGLRRPPAAALVATRALLRSTSSLLGRAAAEQAGRRRVEALLAEGVAEPAA
jgi:uncharacterized protein (DUF2236 family)